MPYPPAPQQWRTTTGVVTDLERLTALHAAGSISAAEYEALKQRLI